MICLPNWIKYEANIFWFTRYKREPIQMYIKKKSNGSIWINNVIKTNKLNWFEAQSVKAANLRDAILQSIKTAFQSRLKGNHLTPVPQLLTQDQTTVKTKWRQLTICKFSHHLKHQKILILLMNFTWMRSKTVEIFPMQITAKLAGKPHQII